MSCFQARNLGARGKYPFSEHPARTTNPFKKTDSLLFPRTSSLANPSLPNQPSPSVSHLQPASGETVSTNTKCALQTSFALLHLVYPHQPIGATPLCNSASPRLSNLTNTLVSRVWLASAALSPNPPIWKRKHQRAPPSPNEDHVCGRRHRGLLAGGVEEHVTCAGRDYPQHPPQFHSSQRSPKCTGKTKKLRETQKDALTHLKMRKRVQQGWGPTAVCTNDRWAWGKPTCWTAPHPPARRAFRHRKLLPTHTDITLAKQLSLT